MLVPVVTLLIEGQVKFLFDATEQAVPFPFIVSFLLFALPVIVTVQVVAGSTVQVS